MREGEVWARETTMNVRICMQIHQVGYRLLFLLMARSHAFAWVFELEMGDAFCKAAEPLIKLPQLAALTMN